MRHPLVPKIKKKKSRFFSIENYVDIRQKCKKRGNAEFEAKLLKLLDTPTPNLQLPFNEDRAFFDSLLPTLANFDEDQKWEFRVEMLQLIKRVKTKAP